MFCFFSPKYTNGFSLLLFDMLILTFWNNRQSNLHVTVSALVAAAVVWMSELPARLNPIILPLMASIKREQVVCWV